MKQKYYFASEYEYIPYEIELSKLIYQAKQISDNDLYLRSVERNYAEEKSEFLLEEMKLLIDWIYAIYDDFDNENIQEIKRSLLDEIMNVSLMSQKYFEDKNVLFLEELRNYLDRIHSLLIVKIQNTYLNANQIHNDLEQINEMTEKYGFYKLGIGIMNKNGELQSPF